MIYTEKQKFNQPWIWIGLIITALLMIILFGIGINKQLIHGQTFGNHPMSDTGLIVTFILVWILFMLIFLLIGLARLTTVIDRTGIRYQFFPFQLSFQKISWDAIDSYQVITYNPVHEYGGWGVRSKKNATAFNVSGDKGLQMKLKNGKTLLIGTQNATELVSFLERLKQPVT
jgi:hypothetical protein